MGVDRRKMYDLVRANPGILKVPLCGQLDCSEVEFDAAFRDETERGCAIVRHDVVAPNGGPTTAYTMTGTPLPVAPEAVAAKMTNVEKAITYIQSCPEKQATGAQLHNALDLRSDQAPSIVLAEALKDGRLVKEGKWWSVGIGVPSQVVPQSGKPELPGELLERLSAKTRAKFLPTRAEANPPVEPVTPVATKSSEEAVARSPAPRGKIKIEIVIDYLKEHGKSDTHTLRGVLGIVGKSLHPLSYLQNALADGRIKRAGNSWWVPGYEKVNYPAVGPDIPSFVPEKAPAVAENPSVVAQNEEIVPKNPVSVTPAPPVEAAKPEAQTTILDHGLEHVATGQTVVITAKAERDMRSSSPVVQRYRTTQDTNEAASEFLVALLSNSNLELRIDGQTVTLSKARWKHMREFINKVELT